MDKLVTHEDRLIIEDIFSASTPDDWTEEQKEASADLYRRLIAAAEADQPPLPEGWVVESYPDGISRIVWHKGGATSMWSDGKYETVTGPGSRLTPLRPTVTEADVEKAALCYYDDDSEGLAEWPEWSGPMSRQHCKQRARAVLAAAGIEVRDDS